MGGGEAKFIISPEFLYSNHTASIDSIEVDFADGNGNRFLKLFDTITINYSDTLQKIIAIRIHYTNGDIYQCKTTYKKIDTHYIEESEDNTGSRNAGFHFAGNLLMSTLLSSRTYSGHYAKGGVTISYGVQNGVRHNCIKKPLIIVEGIDFGYKKRPTGCKSGKCGSLGFPDFLIGKDIDLESGKINAFPEIQDAPIMIAQLNNAGYDVIYLDFEDGATYIQDNAFLLVDLIEQINDLGCQPDEQVIMGASMGGQVVKWALDYMQSSNIPTCTRVYCSFDSPHQGADIPLGLQHAMTWGASILIPPAKDILNRKLKREATKQLLHNHIYANNWGEHTLRTIFMNELNNMGLYPKRIRKIAVINGSDIASNQGFNAGKKMVDVNLTTFGLPKFNMEIYAACGVTTQYITTPYCFHWAFKLGKNIISEHFYGVPTNCIAYDNAPGSGRNDLNSFDWKFLKSSLVSQNNFITSISALDANTINLYSMLGYASIDHFIPSTNSFHPWDAFYSQSTNQKHVQITVGINSNSQWFFDQIEANKYKLSSLLPCPQGNSYNFSSFEQKFIKSITIQNNGALKINADGYSEFGSGSQNRKPSTCEM